MRLCLQKSELCNFAAHKKGMSSKGQSLSPSKTQSQRLKGEGKEKQNVINKVL